MSSHSKDFNSDYPCTHTNTLLVIDVNPGEAGYRVLCWHPVCRSAGTVMKCKVLLLNYSRGNRLSWLFSESIGRLYRFPPVSRRKGSMTSQSDTQWVTVCMPVPDLPPPSACLPLSVKPLSCPTCYSTWKAFLLQHSPIMRSCGSSNFAFYSTSF